MDEFDKPKSGDAPADAQLSFGVGGKEAFVPIAARTTINPTAIAAIGQADCNELDDFVTTLSSTKFQQQMSVIVDKHCYEVGGIPALKKTEPMHYMAATDEMTSKIEALITELGGLTAEVESIAAEIAANEGITIS